MSTTTTTTEDVLKQYRDQRSSLDKLARQARKVMQERYSELLTEAATINQDFKRDFGAPPELPKGVKAFTLGEAARRPETAEAGSAGKKIGGLRRSLKSAIKKYEKAKSEGKATAELEKRITECVEGLKALNADAGDILIPMFGIQPQAAQEAGSTSDPEAEPETETSFQFDFTQGQ